MPARKGPPQRNYAAASGSPMDKCWTPWHAVAPLLPYIPAGSRIWEPCAGAGWLARWLREAGHTVIATDYDPPADAEGVDMTPRDALSWAPDTASYDWIITNPPWGMKVEIMDALYAHGKPVALLVPAATAGLEGAIEVRNKHGRGWEEMRLRPRICYYMPESGFNNNGAQLPSAWLCSGILPERVIEVKVPAPRPEHRLIKPPKVVRLPLDRAAVLAWLDERLPETGTISRDELADLFLEVNDAGIPQQSIEQLRFV